MDECEARCELAWAAGLFEGEGSLCWNRQGNGRLYPHASVTSTDLDVLQRFAWAVGFGNIGVPVERPGRKRCWKWRAVGPESMRLLDEKIGSWFGDRRRSKMNEMLTFVPCAPRGPERFTSEGWEAVQSTVRSNGLKAKGARNGRAKLTLEDVVAIRTEESASDAALALTYGVSRRQIGRIRSGERWVAA